MKKENISPKKRARAEKFLNKWSVDEMNERNLNTGKNAEPELINECLDELNGTMDLIDALLHISYMNTNKLFDSLNEAFALRMDEMAKDDLIRRETIAQEFSDFTKVTNMLRLALTNKQGLFKIRSRYERAQFDVRALLEAQEEEERPLIEEMERNYQTENLSQ